MCTGIHPLKYIFFSLLAVQQPWSWPIWSWREKWLYNKRWKLSGKFESMDGCVYIISRASWNTGCLILKWDIIDSEKRQQTNIFLIKTCTYTYLKNLTHCTKRVVQTNLPRLGVTYLFGSGMKSTFIWAMPYKWTPGLPIFPKFQKTELTTNFLMTKMIRVNISNIYWTNKLYWVLVLR